MKKKKNLFYVLGIAMVVLMVSLLSSKSVFAQEENEDSTFDFNVTETIHSILETEPEITEIDLTNLSSDEINNLDDSTYMEYQMQTDNYTIEEDGTIVIPDNRVQSTDEVSIMCIACNAAVWKVNKESGSSTVYGSWKTIDSGQGPGSLSVTVSETRNHSYTGTLSAPVKAVNAAVGFTIGKSITYSSTYTGTIPKGKHGKLQIRPTYTKYTVRQRKVANGGAGKVLETKYVYPQKFTHMDKRVSTS